jgi:hypothetical protein
VKWPCPRRRKRAEALEAPVVDRAAFPRDYVGPTRVFRGHGTLMRGAPCKVTRRNAGNTVTISVPDGLTWIVPDAQVKRPAA